MTQRGTRLLVIGTALVAFAAGVLLWAALDLVATGYRVDEEGTTMRRADMLLGWGGFGLGLVLASIGAVVLGLAQAHVHREQRDLAEHRAG